MSLDNISDEMALRIGRRQVRVERLEEALNEAVERLCDLAEGEGAEVSDQIYKITEGLERAMRG